MSGKQDEKGAVRLIHNSTAELLIFTGQAGENLNCLEIPDSSK